MTLQQLLAQALQEHQKGELDRAEKSYRAILAMNPRHPDALNLLGMLLAQTGQLAEGADLARRAVEAMPGFAPFHANLGETYRRLKRLEEAVSSLRRAIELDPRLAESHNNLSAAMADLGRWDEAIAAAERAVKLRADYAGAYFNLGNGLEGKQRREEAIAAYRQAIGLQPGYVDAIMNLGVVYQKSLRFEEAAAMFAEAVRLRPDSTEAYNNLAAAAVKVDPNNMRALSDYGYALAKMGRLDEASAACTAAVSQGNANANAYVQLGFVHKEKGDLQRAVECCALAMQVDPGMAAAHNAMGTLLREMGRIKEAIAVFRRAAELDPAEPVYHSNLVYAMYFDADCAPGELLAEHKTWASRYGDPVRPAKGLHRNNRDPDRRLRIGYVSPDFKGHPVGRFMLPLLAEHDHRNFEIFCYSSVLFPDSFTSRMEALADTWRDARAMTNEQLAGQIAADEIDILVDLTMHMKENRLPVFARKPAPVQATYLAYAGTTGLETIDYRITDRWLDPPGSSDEHYTEKSVRVTSYWCYQAPIENLPSTPPPLLNTGVVTFGCLNNFCKITPGTLETWRRILAEVPGSRLIVHADAGRHRDQFRESLAAMGIDSARLDFVRRLPLREYLEQYGRIDIGLDPFPYVGGTTTCDALWMGVPVVTLNGTTAIARGGVSIMNNVGLTELIGESEDDYVRIAVELARDRERLIRLRENLRGRMTASPLMDAKRFARDMEGAYRWMWKEYMGAETRGGSGT